MKAIAQCGIEWIRIQLILQICIIMIGRKRVAKKYRDHQQGCKTRKKIRKFHKDPSDKNLRKAKSFIKIFSRFLKK
ncbi:MAG: hypothetical protein EBR01_14160 [Proteobacteria bacterium]|nr:hypothetical protein [Pseudomonadota bacterium]